MAIIADKIKIRIDGETFEDYLFSDILLVQKIQKPNELRFLMQKKSLAENEKDIRYSLSEELLGKNVEYFLSTIRDDENGKTYNDVLEFSGIIFNVNILRKNLKAGAVIEVTAYSPDYLLFNNPHCYSYEKETLKNIISKTLEPYNISIQNNPRMTDEIPYMVQYNETDYAFMSRLAFRFGEWLYYNGKELIFGKIEKSDVLTLHLGYDILHYQYRLDVEHLNFVHAHHNYLDYGNTQKDAYSHTEPSVHNLTDIVYDTSKSLYSKETFQHLHHSAPEESAFDETELSTQIQGWGKKAQMMVSQGSSNRTDLRIGSIIKIKEYYEKENRETAVCYHDELMICKITHTTDYNGNYENEFTAIPATCEIPPYTYNNCYPKAETQRAVVMDNKDPEQLGRVRVQFLWQKEQDDNLITPWIRIAQPHGGDNKGFYFIPEIGEEVMVGFENGNAEKPYVIGTLYHGQQHPGENWYTDENEVKAIRTRNGHTVEIHDVADGGFIRIYDNEKENYVLTLSTDDQLIRLQSSGNIELYAENDIILDAKNNIKISAGMNLSKEAGENIDETAGKDVIIGSGENMSINAGNDMDTCVGNNNTLYVSSNQTIEIGANKDEMITEKYQLSVENMLIDASEKLKLQSKKHEQKADETMKFDGGKGLDLFAKAIKMN
jgi:Rhs element Vgr protein